MGTPYCSFLVRCWRLHRGERRIEVQHIQSGHRRPFASIQAAIEWISACCAESVDEQTKPPERPKRPDQPP
jgi:hypothetical protein